MTIPNRRRSWTAQAPTALLLASFLWAVHRAAHVPTELLDYYELVVDAGSKECRLPRLDPWDPSILSYVARPEPLKCKRLQPEVAWIDDRGRLFVNTSALGGGDDVSCHYRCFDHNQGVDDDNVLYGDLIPVTGPEPVVLACEFVEVSCKKGLISAYNYHLAHVRPREKPKPKRKGDEKLSVLLLGIDSMSTSNVVRQLPNTLQFLTETMGAVIFDGHTKVGDNTWVNTMAMLIGKRAGSTKEFPSELDTSTYERFFDDWAQYIWQNFSASGYVTLYAEDRPDIHNFNYKPKKGFRFRPTDYYFRPYWLAAYWSFLHMRSSAFCYDVHPDHAIQLNWLERFLRLYPDSPYFAFFWSQNLSHDVLNKVGVADDDIRDLLQRSLPALNRTIVFVISDHGHRYDSIRQSVIGRLEARMPFLAVYVPPWLRQRHPRLMENLRANAGGLTTQFDIFATLRDILEERFEGPPLVEGHGQSLFFPISRSRTCAESNIPEEYCPCYQEVPLEATDERVVQAAARLLAYVKELLAPAGPKCAELSLRAVKDAFLFLPNQGTLRDPQVGGRVPSRGFYVSYRIVVEVAPNGALLEAVVKRFLDSGTLKVDGEVDRNNAYGNTSACVDTPALKKLCYCL